MRLTDKLHFSNWRPGGGSGHDMSLPNEQCSVTDISMHADHLFIGLYCKNGVKAASIKILTKEGDAKANKIISDESNKSIIFSELLNKDY